MTLIPPSGYSVYVLPTRLEHGRRKSMAEEIRYGIDPSWMGIYKVSGLSLFAGGAILVMFLILVFILQVPLPLTPQAILENPMPPVTLFGLAAIGEFLLMPGVLGLYHSLKDIKKAPVLVGTAVWLAAIPMFLFSRGQIISLLPISSSYLGTASETLRAAYLVSAELAIEAANVYAVMALDLLQVGAVIIGLVMLKGAFGRGISYLVIGAGVLTIMGSFGVLLEFLTVLTIFGLILTAFWQMVVGAKLYKLA